MAKEFDNGVTGAYRKSNTTGFRQTPRNIATIDFGTTHCSVTYKINAHLTSDTEKPELLKLDESGPLAVRVPSCIIFNQEGQRLFLGYQARNHYNRMDHSLRPCYIYFEHIKMSLQHDAVSLIIIVHRH